MLINYSDHNPGDFTEKMQRYQEYIEALEEERRKIQVFQRELPLCLELVTQAIETCKQQLSGTTTEYIHGQSECSEQTSSEAPVLEEFIPIKRASPSDNEQQSQKPKNDNRCNNRSCKDSKSNDKSSKKSDWLRSVQLWNQTPDPPANEESPKKVSVMEVKKNGSGAFHPFKREKSASETAPASTTGGSPSAGAAPAAVASSTADTGGSSGGSSGGSKKEEKEGQSQRKARRCWSPELHRRFLQALQQLGGSHAATPKQIRELMKVDGLTNDEVKSHLQKYRLHSRRPGPSNHNATTAPAPQFVVVGGIWMPPPEYAAVTTAGGGGGGGEASGVATPGGIYAPVASLPASISDAAASLSQRQQHKQMHHSRSDERGSHSEGGVHSNSPGTSSSTHTTISPSY